MPKTIPGRLSALMIVVFIIQFVAFLFTLTMNGFGAIVGFIQVTPFTSLLGLMFGVIGAQKEKGKAKTIPVISLSVGVLYVIFWLYFLYGWSFGR
ncbi:hypothetical protein [Halobacillus naozhouensis]|uniref:Uncharacterized protein n=1 Tax=Halobacillus naozhouensis TaxID=554880 RepID=A0ABY8J0J2_9BACI|nr:hypothetical protein [Halobacillus naozhouensis]WFT76005.1 hypothetical protein P9989_06485 [Halobacillus naozhouensis]